MDALIQRRIRQFSEPAERVGATYRPGEGVYIRLWAPYLKEAAIEWNAGSPVALSRDDKGYFTGHFPDRKPGDRYFFVSDGKKFPDPASRFQPESVPGPSAVVADDYGWTDQNWRSVPYNSWVIYEIHTGTFSSSHDFTGIIADLPRLKDLGVTTLEIMPVSQFSGARNWGYDGVFPHAVQDSYGGSEGLKSLVNACHRQDMAIILDVVFNHIGPEGNVLFSCGPYVQKKYKTPWGEALNYDGEDSDEVRRYFLQAAWQWLTEYRFDGLRLDAIQTIFDTSAVPFLEELTRLKKEAERVRGHLLILIAETDMNDSRVVQPVEENGLGMDGHWADDLHHALHATLTGEQAGYYQDYGGAAQIAKIYRRGVAYEDEYSLFRRRYHGRSYEGIDKKRLVVETQNHDQVGNRLQGERLAGLIDREKLKLAAACVLLSPFTPFLFMGEEWAAENPFLYFVSHSDEKLNRMIRDGRREEWRSFGWTQEAPDPSALDTFEKCVLPGRVFEAGDEKTVMQAYYKALISLSKTIRHCDLKVDYREAENYIILEYAKTQPDIVVFLSFGAKETSYKLPDQEEWTCVLSSAQFQADRCPARPLTLAPFSATVFTRAD